MTSAYDNGGHGAAEWAAEARHRLGPGRLLPLGDAADSAWLAETAAVARLRLAAREVPGVVPGRLRVSATVDATAPHGGAPRLPGALPRGPLRVEAEFAAVAGEPLPALAGRLREALFTCAADALGLLLVTAVDLRVTGLLDARPEGPGEDYGPGVGPIESASTEGPGAAAAAVPGVAGLTRTLGGAALSGGGHVGVEVAVEADRHPLDVARAVRAAVRAEHEQAPVTVVITTLVPQDRPNA